MNGGLVTAYVDLLIKQYWEQPNARAEVAVWAGKWQELRDHIDSCAYEFDLDHAWGDRLDKIGAIVGMPRRIPYAIPKRFFGFAETPSSGGFDDDANHIPGLPPLYDESVPLRETLELEDGAYSLFLKIKIAKNAALPVLAAGNAGMSIQEAVVTAFEGGAYVVDNKDMSLTLYLSPSIDSDTFTTMRLLDLLPRPQGVEYKHVVQSFFGQAFGFDVNPNCLGFSDDSDPSRVGGKLSREVY